MPHLNKVYYKHTLNPVKVSLGDTVVNIDDIKQGQVEILTVTGVDYKNRTAEVVNTDGSIFTVYINRLRLIDIEGV